MKLISSYLPKSSRPAMGGVGTFSTAKRLIMRCMEKGQFWGTSLGSMMRG